MSYWIFKLIWIPLFTFITIVLLAIASWIARDVGWEQPFRWMVLIGTIAYIADRMVNP